MEVPGKRTDTDDEAENIASVDKLCEPCEVGNVNIPASSFCKECEEYMCTACFTQHLRLKSCRFHTLLDINASSETCLKRHSRATKCKQHGGEVIKFYCRKHQAVGCGDCMVLGHNACKSEYIKDLSNKFQQNEEYKTIMSEIVKLISDRKEYEEKIQENKQVNTVMLEKALRDIKQFRLDINKYLDKVETDITGQAKNVMEENVYLLTELENQCTVLSTKLEEITNKLNSELYKDDVLFIHTVECKPTLTECEEAISDMKSKSTKQYKFVCSQQMRSLFTSAQELGTLDISTSTVLPQTTERAHQKSEKGDRQERSRQKVEGGENYETSEKKNDQTTTMTKYGGKSVVAVGARVRANWGSLTGTVTYVHDESWVTVKWNISGSSRRCKIGVGDDEVTLIKS